MPSALKYLSSSQVLAKDIAHVCEHRGFPVEKSLLAKVVEELVSSGILERGFESDASQLALPLGIPKKTTPQPRHKRCGPISGKLPKGSGRAKLGKSVSVTDLDSIVICSACCFAREGYKDMHSFENLSLIRDELVKVLTGTEYVIEEAALRRNPTQWSAQEKWACLAGVAGMPETSRFDVVRLARKSQGISL